MTVNLDPCVTRWFRCSEPSAVAAVAFNKRLAKWLEILDPVEVLDLRYNPENRHLTLVVGSGEAYRECVSRLNELLQIVESFVILSNNGKVFQSVGSMGDQIVSGSPREIVN